MKPNICLIVALAMLLLPLTLQAQVPNENLANSILAARKKNATLLQQYNWNSRTEILQNGTTQDIRIDQVSCGPNGQPQRSLLNDQPGQLPGRFLRKAIEENQRKQLEKYISELSTLVDQYTLPSAGKVLDFLVTSKVQPVTTPDGTTVLRMNGNNVVVPGDAFTLTVDGRTLHTKRVDITTAYNGDAVTMTATFKTMANGLNHLQYATVEVPAKNITLMIHNYDYIPNN